MIDTSFNFYSDANGGDPFVLAGVSWKGPQHTAQGLMLTLNCFTMKTPLWQSLLELVVLLDYKRNLDKGSYEMQVFYCDNPSGQLRFTVY